MLRVIKTVHIEQFSYWEITAESMRWLTWQSKRKIQLIQPSFLRYPSEGWHRFYQDNASKPRQLPQLDHFSYLFIKSYSTFLSMIWTSTLTRKGSEGLFFNFSTISKTYHSIWTCQACISKYFVISSWHRWLK